MSLALCLSLRFLSFTLSCLRRGVAHRSLAIATLSVDHHYTRLKGASVAAHNDAICWSIYCRKSRLYSVDQDKSRCCQQITFYCGFVSAVDVLVNRAQAWSMYCRSTKVSYHMLTRPTHIWAFLALSIATLAQTLLRH